MRGPWRVGVAILILIAGIPWFADAQAVTPPALRAGTGAETVRLDGVLNEPAWTTAETTGAFANVRPAEEHNDEQGMLLSSLEAVYLPSAGKPAVRGGGRR